MQFFQHCGGGECPAFRVGRLASCGLNGVGRAVGMGVRNTVWVCVYAFVAYMVVARVAPRLVFEVKRSGSKQRNTGLPQQRSALPPHTGPF